MSQLLSRLFLTLHCFWSLFQSRFLHGLLSEGMKTKKKNEEIESFGASFIQSSKATKLQKVVPKIVGRSRSAGSLRLKRNRGTQRRPPQGISGSTFFCYFSFHFLFFPYSSGWCARSFEAWLPKVGNVFAANYWNTTIAKQRNRRKETEQRVPEIYIGLYERPSQTKVKKNIFQITVEGPSVGEELHIHKKHEEWPEER